MKKKKLKKFDKYWYYRHSVQSPDQDVRFIEKTYLTLRNRQPCIFREDFSFTFAICCEWVKLGAKHRAVAVDCDKEPLKYGRQNYLPLLKPAQQQRVSVVRSNVLSKCLPHADIIAALNFSYFIFKKRAQMKKYFSYCRKALHNRGLLVLDCFGGTGVLNPTKTKSRVMDLLIIGIKLILTPYRMRPCFASIIKGRESANGECFYLQLALVDHS